VVRLPSAETEFPPICSHSVPKPKPKPKFGRPRVVTQSIINLCSAEEQKVSNAFERHVNTEHTNMLILILKPHTRTKHGVNRMTPRGDMAI